MDVDTLIRSDAAKLRLDLVAPPRPPRSDAPPLAPPGRANPILVETAFHYLLRFDLQRRHPRARDVAWLAEGSPARLEHTAPEMADRAASLVSSAREDHAHFLRSVDPRPELVATMSAHALRLARLDAAVRAGYVDERIMEDERAEDVADLLRMRDIVPWATLGGGASADLGHSDLILDGRLLLVRTGRSANVDAEDVRSLLVRLVLAREARAQDPTFPEVGEIGVYAARHARLWTASASDITAHAGFPAVEAWLRARIDAGQREERAKPPSWARKRKSPGFGSAAERKVGKAEPKKTAAADAAPRPRAQMRDAPPEPPAEDPPAKPTRPDWRKGSPWRRDRGL